MWSSPAGAASMTRRPPRDCATRWASRCKARMRTVISVAMCSSATEILPLPKLTYKPQRGSDHLVVDLFRRQAGIHRLADRNLSRDLLGRQQRFSERARDRRDPRLTTPLRVVLSTLAHLLATGTILRLTRPDDAD